MISIRYYTLQTSYQVKPTNSTQNWQLQNICENSFDNLMSDNNRKWVCWPSRHNAAHGAHFMVFNTFAHGARCSCTHMESWAPKYKDARSQRTYFTFNFQFCRRTFGTNFNYSKHFEKYDRHVIRPGDVTSKITLSYDSNHTVCSVHKSLRLQLFKYCTESEKTPNCFLSIKQNGSDNPKRLRIVSSLTDFCPQRLKIYGHALDETSVLTIRSSYTPMQNENISSRWPLSIVMHKMNLEPTIIRHKGRHLIKCFPITRLWQPVAYTAPLHIKGSTPQRCPQ